MRLIITSLILLFSTLSLTAQSLKVTETTEAQEALAKINSARKATMINGYRVGIFFDNSPDARYKASEAKAKFTKSYPSEPIYMLYESPYYKVSVGDCQTEEEAIMLFERVRGLFPSAYVMRENIKLTAFASPTSIITQPITNSMGEVEEEQIEEQRLSESNEWQLGE